MSEKKRRTFIAIGLSDGLREKLRQVVQDLTKAGGDIRCVKPENTHLTLRFLGGTEESKLDEIKKAMEKTLQGVSPFKISFYGIGTFPGIENPRVLWVGVKEGKEKLREIRDVLEENLLQTGIEKEDRKYRSHLTLGRVKSQRGKDRLVSWIKSNENLDFGSMKADRIVFMESILKPQEGAKYKPLGVVNLKL